jgi:hypothetical protein
VSRTTRRLLRLVSLSALTVAGPLAGTSGAATQTFTTTGSHPFVVPSGVTSVQVDAVGGAGGFFGGFGARVTASLPVTPGETLTIAVAGNGGNGQAGAGGGGAAGGPAAGGGGGASRVIQAGQSRLVAAGGGGGGSDSFPGLGGLGGDGDAAGEPGETVAAVAGGGGGGAATTSAAGTPGTAGPSPDVACVGGAPGTPNPPAGVGGAGGQSADPFGFGDGGGGGGGVFGGGGGGSGGYCATEDEGLGGGGGGGGSSLVPAGGSLAVADVPVPSVALTWTESRPPANPQPRVAAPLVMIRVPRDGTTYSQGAAVRSSFGCLRAAECVGPVANGAAIDTSTPGEHVFTVRATGSTGERAERTVRYTVVDRTPPAVSALRLSARAIDLDAPRRAWSRLRFALSEPAQVIVRLFRGRAGRAARVLRLDGRAGRNSLRLRARVGRRTLRAGSYRLTLVAIDAAGNRSRTVSRRLSIE